MAFNNNLTGDKKMANTYYLLIQTIMTLAAVIPRLLTQGLMALRSTCVMPRLVNRDYDKVAAKQGATVDVPLPSNIAVQDVAPSVIPNDTQASAPSFVPIPLSEWKEAPFFLSDKDIKESMDGVSFRCKRLRQSVTLLIKLMSIS